MSEDNYCHCTYPLFCPICGKEFSPITKDDLLEESEVTDVEIAKFADRYLTAPLIDQQTTIQEAMMILFRAGVRTGAKALRDGLIKKNENS